MTCISNYTVKPFYDDYEPGCSYFRIRHPIRPTPSSYYTSENIIISNTIPYETSINFNVEPKINDVPLKDYIIETVKNNPKSKMTWFRKLKSEIIFFFWDIGWPIFRYYSNGCLIDESRSYLIKVALWNPFNKIYRNGTKL